ncbi:MAG TPA: hypothetical protein VM510_17520 [Caulifigura sp.]|nr:hypothetical protein [Caulifigura sp.]
MNSGVGRSAAQDAVRRNKGVSLTASPNNELTFAIKVSEAVSPEVEFVFKNGRQQDSTINLGMMLANGETMFPSAVVLTDTDAAGKTRRLKLEPGYVAGRVDDLLVPLRKGSSYSMRFPLSEFSDLSTGGRSTPLSPGKHRFQARLVSETVRHLNSGSEDARLLKVWAGTLQSEVVDCEVPSPAM